MSAWVDAVKLALELKTLAYHEPLVRKTEAEFGERFNALLVELRGECGIPAPGNISGEQELGARSQKLYEELLEYVGGAISEAMAQEPDGLLRLFIEEKI